MTGRKLQSVPQAGVTGECQSAENQPSTRIPRVKKQDFAENFAYKLCTKIRERGVRPLLGVRFREDGRLGTFDLRRLGKARGIFHSAWKVRAAIADAFAPACHGCCLSWHGS